MHIVNVCHILHISCHYRDMCALTEHFALSLILLRWCIDGFCFALADDRTSSVSQDATAPTEYETASLNASTFAWLEDALKDIAYYLRSHKFNDFDRRYETKAETAVRAYFGAFPRPPLRSLHWEVHRYCETSFLSCVEYLKRRIRGTGLKRTDDTSTIIQEQKWDKHKHSHQINATEWECRKLLKSEEVLANPFEGPIERFQWRVTASYYMCWYTMNKEPHLRHLNDNCDNFASCLDPKFGTNNKDPRARDNIEYGCALYSFCPDPCCPVKHVYDLDACWSLKDNPCLQASLQNQRQCALNQSQNTDFRELILNHWNVTCKCPQSGYEWSSRYGICIDIDECARESHGCRFGDEACVNLQGGFRCACSWGYVWQVATKRCVPSAALSLIKLRRSQAKQEKEKKMATSLVKRILKLFQPSSNAICRVYRDSIFGLVVSLLVTRYVFQ